VRRVTVIRLAGSVVGAALLGGCAVQAPRNAEIDPVDWGSYDLVPCDFDLSCRNAPASAGLLLVDPAAPELVAFAADDPVPTDLVKSYLARIRNLERELQQARLERAQLERQLQALREIEREVARASGARGSAPSGRPMP
jgi:hypothetical protein